MSWVALALSDDIEAGTSTGVLLDGRELVIWRDSHGRAHVWDDRCPHRGMRMSFGFVRGDRIACLYHGWQYDTAGQCRAIPAHPDLAVPATIRVTTHPAIEVAGMVWTCLSADVPAPPEIEAGEVTPVRSVFIDRPIAVVVEALGRLTEVESNSWAIVVDFAAFSPAVWRLRAGTDRLLIACQIIDAARCALHIAILGDPSDHAGDGQAQVAQWAEALRDRLEASEAVT